MKIMKRVGLCAGIALAITYQSASAAELTGACYDYASREPTSAVKLDGQAIGMVVANNVINTALGVSGFSLLEGLYPIIYGSITGGFVTETTDGSDPELVGCLQQFNNRISDLESAFVEADLNTLNSILSRSKTEIIDLGNLDYHDDAADAYQALAVKLGNTIKNTLDEVYEENPSIKKATYDSLVYNVAPAFVSIIQMELLHRREFNRFCFNQEVYPTWNGIDSNRLVDPELLDTIKYNDSEFIDSYLTTPEGSVANCNADYNTFLTFDRVIGDEFDSYKLVLEKLGIFISENTQFPGMISASVDVYNSELGAYREMMLNQCDSDHNFTDDYYSHTEKSSESSRCEFVRGLHVNRITPQDVFYDDYRFTAEAERNLILHNLAAVVDSWDWYSHVTPEAVAQLDEDTMRLYEAFAVPTYSGVRLRYIDTDLCVGSDSIAQHTCEVNQNLFMFRPYGDGYQITRISDNKNFKDKGEESGGFVILSGSGEVSKWYADFTGAFGLDPYPNFVNALTGRCLALDENSSLTAVNCDEIDNNIWDLDGIDIPDTHSLVSMRHIEENVCVGADDAAVNCDTNSVIYQIFPYNDGYRIERGGKNMKDKGDSGILFIGGLGDVATWDIMDWNSDGVFRLVNRLTDMCLDYEDGSLIATSCKLDPDLSELFTFDIVNLANASNGEKIFLYHASEKRCLTGQWTYGDFTAVITTECSGGDVGLVKYNGGYMIYDILNDQYIEDNDTAGYSYESIGISDEPSDSTTWDFLGPYNISGVDYYNIKNRATGDCLLTEITSEKSWPVISKGDCSSSDTRVWTPKTTFIP